MASRRILLIVTAEDCGACGHFKESTWPTLKKKLIQFDDLDWREIFQRSRSDPIDPKRYPRDLQRHIGWYPTLLLFTAESWFRAKENPNERLEGKIFGGHFDANGRVAFNPSLEITTEKILAWIRETVDPSGQKKSDTTVDYPAGQQPSDFAEVSAKGRRICQNFRFSIRES